MKKNAFTLIEVLTALTIIGVIAVVMIACLKQANEGLTAKISKSKILKTIDAVQTAFNSIKEFETTQCPMQALMVETSAGNWEFAIRNSSNNADATTEEVLTLLRNYLKFQQAPLNFCDSTSYCSDNTIIGGKLFDGVYIGIKKGEILNCPNYYTPDGETVTGTGKCWGKLYIRLDDAQNKTGTEGQDIFVYGLDQYGVKF